LRARSRIAAAVLAAGLAACGQSGDTDGGGDPVRAGGDTTVFRADREAYSLPAANIPVAERDRFFVGNAFFKQPWVIAPASTAARDGLGPLYNTNTCQGCHIKDGRGHAPRGPEDDALSMLVRLSVPATEADAEMVGKFGAVPHPVYGGQLQDRGVPGVPAEGRAEVRYDTRTVTLADGTEVALREPRLRIAGAGYGEPGDDLMTSARVAPPMIGLGLLGLIPEADIRAAADPGDADGDGISGRANTVWDFAAGRPALGRFGWKAGQPTVRQQAAAAFVGDIGLTSQRFPAANCTAAQTACAEAPNGGEPEVSAEIMDEVVFYSRHLAVPARRDIDDPKVREGRRLFMASGCGGCHTPRHTTGHDPDAPYLSGQTIYPYTDLLLHDMGEGLADHRPEFEADGREWRTPPLWGIGLAKTVSPEAGFLHDGRARDLLEAVLWHGGEAAAARDEVKNMSENEREALMAFLRSL